MAERLRLERPDVYLVVKWDETHDTGLVHRVVCEHPDGVDYASKLADRIGVPLEGPPPPRTDPGRTVDGMGLRAERDTAG